MAPLRPVLACLCLLLPQSVAQHATTALTGRVRDITGAGIPGTQAELRSEQNAVGPFRATAGAEGRFQFAGLPAGNYSLKLMRPGFKYLTLKSLGVGNGEDTSLPDLQLEVANVADCGGHAYLEYVRLLPAIGRTGDISGIVRASVPDVEVGQPVAGVDIKLLCGLGEICAAAKTDSQGRFTIIGLPPGRDSVSFTVAGFYPLTLPGFVVQEGLESVYNPIGIERCFRGNCDPKLRPKQPLRTCE